MSGEIKVRVWNTEENKMIYNAQATYDYGCSGIDIMEESFGEVCNNDMYIKMLYSRLKDRKETEIYEDDIVRAIGFEPEIHRVEFIQGGFCLTNPTISGFPIDINICYPSIGCQLEVVGNMYETPNLLGGK